MYPGDPGNPGGDCAGVVVAAGVGASAGAGSGGGSLGLGQRVFGLAVGSLGTAVACAADTMVAAPDCLSFEEAASMPTVFITARAALAQVAGVAPGGGERVLLSAAAGGVGLAALQVAGALGAVPLGSAGSPAKRALLRSLGVGAVASSRDAGFAADLAVGAGGAHVVLNSLTSPGMVAAALAVLRRGGRLVEIGKRDVWSGAAVAAMRPDVAYSLLAVDFLPGREVQAALRAVAAGAAAGALRPLPLVGHSLGGVAAALRALSQARHVGKIIVRGATAPPPASPAGRVLVTGGTGYLGGLVAAWLAHQRVGTIELLGRSARVGAALAPLLAAAGGASCTVRLTQCDAAAAADLAPLFSGSGSGSGSPVEAVFHVGGVLADATLAAQSLRGVRAVAAAKGGALGTLLPLQRRQPGAATVLFSSVAALLGSPGQANYAAANAALDGAAARLQAGGAPALSIQWGAWAGAGMAAADPQTAARVERLGMSLIAPAAGLAALEAALAAATSGGAARSAPPARCGGGCPSSWRRFLAAQRQSQARVRQGCLRSLQASCAAPAAPRAPRRAAAAGGPRRRRGGRGRGGRARVAHRDACGQQVLGGAASRPTSRSSPRASTRWARWSCATACRWRLRAVVLRAARTPPPPAADRQPPPRRGPRCGWRCRPRWCSTTPASPPSPRWPPRSARGGWRGRGAVTALPRTARRGRAVARPAAVQRAALGAARRRRPRSRSPPLPSARRARRCACACGARRDQRRAV